MGEHEAKDPRERMGGGGRMAGRPGGCGTAGEAGRQLPWPDSTFPAEIYLQGSFKPLVSISPNDR